MLAKVTDPKETSDLRAKFQALIIKSSLVRPEYLLSRLEKTDMHQEKAILHGKVKKTIKLIVVVLTSFLFSVG